MAPPLKTNFCEREKETLPIEFTLNSMGTRPFLLSLDSWSFAYTKLTAQMANRNPNQGFRSTANARNGLDPSGVPQGLVGSVMPIPFEGSGMPASPTDIARPPLSSVLMSALRSASLEQQRTVMFLTPPPSVYWFFFTFFKKQKTQYNIKFFIKVNGWSISK